MVKNNKLISRAQSGDEQAFAELMRAYYAYVYAVVIKIVNNRHDAEEVVQDTFFNAYRGLPQLEDRTKFKGWLAKIARNRARNWRRSQKVDTVSIDEVGEHTLQVPDAVDDELIRAEQRELIRRAMETLPEKDREIARSYYLDGASYDELIQTHGLSYKAISFRLSRVKQKLAKRLSHLLTAIFVPPATTLKQIYSGGLIAMKIGTAPKITIGIIGIIALIFIGLIGSRQLLLSKNKHSQSVEAVGQTSDTTAQSVTQTDATRRGDPTKPSSEAQRTISEKERQQIKRFFSQFEDPDAQSEADTPQSATASESEIEVISTDTDELLSTTKQSAEDVMNAYVEAYRNFDFEVMLSLKTGTAREVFEEGFERFKRIFSGELPETEVLMNNMMSKGYSEESVNESLQVILEMWREMYRTAELVSREYVGEEFHFRVGIVVPQRIPKVPKQPESIVRLYKMQKVDGAWRIYETGPGN